MRRIAEGVVVGVDPGVKRVHAGAVEVRGGVLHYVDSVSVEDLHQLRDLLGQAVRVAVEKPGGVLYGRVRYDHLVTTSVNAGRVYQMALERGAEVLLVNAHGKGGWRPALLKGGKGRRAPGQEEVELELLLPRLVRGLPLRDGRLKGAISEHKRDALGIAVAAALGLV